LPIGWPTGLTAPSVRELATMPSARITVVVGAATGRLSGRPADACDGE
jgi:hypothetical protein